MAMKFGGVASTSPIIVADAQVVGSDHFTSGIGTGTTIIASTMSEAAVEAFGSPAAANATIEANLTYRVMGPGVSEATVRQPTRFSVAATDSSTGSAIPTAGMPFFVTIRGVARVHARTVQGEDNLYTVEWKPSMSGPYTITVSKRGKALPGSPFTLVAATPLPHPAHCIVSARTMPVARVPPTPIRLTQAPPPSPCFPTIATPQAPTIH